MNQFYNQPKAIQWITAILMLLLLFVMMGLWIDSTTENPLNYFYIFLMAPFFQFLIAPFFTLIGTYQYLSPMLLVFAASEETYDLHNGTSFDYMLVMYGTKGGRVWQQKILGYYIEGLLEVVKRVENGTLPDTIKVSGSSYFFSDRTAKRLGFELSETGTYEKFNLLINYVDLLWMYSISKGKLTFPNLKNIKTATTTGKLLVANKPKLLKLQAFLSKKTAV